MQSTWKSFYLNMIPLQIRGMSNTASYEYFDCVTVIPWQELPKVIEDIND